jgi:acyl-coenzyme A thioesterase PaaI-like protein
VSRVVASFFVSLTAHFLSRSDLLVVVAGARVIHAGMTTKLAEVKQERNTALLKVIEKDGTIGRLSEQLQSKCQISALPSLFSRTRLNLSFCSPFRGQDRVGAVADVSGAGCCRMDLPGPTTSVGTRTDYSVGPWDYLTCAARYLMA